MNNNELIVYLNLKNYNKILLIITIIFNCIVLSTLPITIHYIKLIIVVFLIINTILFLSYSYYNFYEIFESIFKTSYKFYICVDNQFIHGFIDIPKEYIAFDRDDKCFYLKEELLNKITNKIINIFKHHHDPFSITYCRYSNIFKKYIITSNTTVKYDNTDNPVISNYLHLEQVVKCEIPFYFIYPTEGKKYLSSIRTGKLSNYDGKTFNFQENYVTYDLTTITKTLTLESFL